MKNGSQYLMVYLILVLLSAGTCLAQDSSGIKTKKTESLNKNSHSREFIDKNGDGYNDNAPDHDGDGIPNGLDSDYLKLKKRRNGKNLPWIDLDCDGINDNKQFGKIPNSNFQFQGKGINSESSRPGHSTGSTIQNGKSQKHNGKNR